MQHERTDGDLTPPFLQASGSFMVEQRLCFSRRVSFLSDSLMEGYHSSWTRQSGGARGEADDNNQDSGEDPRRGDDSELQHRRTLQLSSSFSSQVMMGMPMTVEGWAQDVFSHDHQSYTHQQSSGASRGVEDYQRYHDPTTRSQYEDTSEDRAAAPENYNYGYTQNYPPRSEYTYISHNPSEWQLYPDMQSSSRGGSSDPYQRQGVFSGAASAEPTAQYHRSYHEDVHEQRPYDAAMTMPDDNNGSAPYPSSYEQQEQQFLRAQQHQHEMHMRMMHEQQQHYAQGMHWGPGGPWYNHPHAAVMHPPPHAAQYAAYGNTMATMHGGYSGSSRSSLGYGAAGYTRSDSQSESITGKRRRPKREKDKDKPKRPLSAYNLFFKDERTKLLAELALDSSSSNKGSTEGADANDCESELEGSEQKKRKVETGDATDTKPKGVGFAPMAKQIAAGWKNIDGETLEKYKKLAEEDMQRYRKEMEAYRKKQKAGIGQSSEEPDKNVAENTKEPPSFSKKEKDNKE